MAYVRSNACDGSPPTVASVTTTSSEVLAANPKRVGLAITNTGNRTAFMSCGNPAEAGKGVPLFKDQCVVFSTDLLPVTSITAITGSGSTTLAIQEFI